MMSAAIYLSIIYLSICAAGSRGEDIKHHRQAVSTLCGHRLVAYTRIQNSKLINSK